MSRDIGNVDAYMAERYRVSNNQNCENKKAYPSFQEAQKFNNQMKRTRLKRGKKEKLHVYKCHSCGQFHLGHPKRRRNKQPYNRKRVS